MFIALESRLRPLIAITCDHETVIDRRGQPSPRFLVPESYVTAVLGAGGEPLVLPHRSPTDAARLLGLVQGLVITGGDFDVPPAYYGQTPRPKLGKTLEARSGFERALLTEALARRMPVLGVCGGMQLMNVIAGGTLHQDVSERPGTAEHTQPFDKRRPFHPVRVTADSLLARATGCRELQVNSTHHQLVAHLGKDVRATALAPDGVIEALELTAYPFALGVQWHPELLPTDEHLSIYRALITASAVKSARR